MNSKVLLSEANIKKRVEELGKQISEHYKKRNAKELVVIGVLKGSFIFLADLVRQFSLPCEIDFVEASSYVGTSSSGEVAIKRDPPISLEGRDVLLVEDIIDTGLTMVKLLDHFKSRNAQSVAVCSLLFKPSRTKEKVRIDFLGFKIDDHFVVGYGLDFNDRYRELKDIVILDPKEGEHS